MAWNLCCLTSVLCGRCLASEKACLHNAGAHDVVDVVCEWLQRLLCDRMTRSLEITGDKQLKDPCLPFFHARLSKLRTEWSQDGTRCQHGTQNVPTVPRLDETELREAQQLEQDEIITSGGGEQGEPGKLEDKVPGKERDREQQMDAEQEQVTDSQRKPEEETDRLPFTPNTKDDSMRCRASDICEAEAGLCHAGQDNLGCVLSVDERREHVVGAIRWAWSSYRKCAWGLDELQPISCQGHQWFGLGLTLVDSLDTLVLAGLEEVRHVALSIHPVHACCNARHHIGAMHVSNHLCEVVQASLMINEQKL
jgi:Glycosyl hydrolase family 47